MDPLGLTRELQVLNHYYNLSPPSTVETPTSLRNQYVVVAQDGTKQPVNCAELRWVENK